MAAAREQTAGRACRLLPSVYLQVRANGQTPVMVAVREHARFHEKDNGRLTLLLVTFHPGFAAGSHSTRAYFERLAA
jgi:hypothetical protein